MEIDFLSLMNFGFKELMDSYKVGITGDSKDCNFALQLIFAKITMLSQTISNIKNNNTEADLTVLLYCSDQLKEIESVISWVFPNRTPEPSKYIAGLAQIKGIITSTQNYLKTLSPTLIQTVAPANNEEAKV